MKRLSLLLLLLAAPLPAEDKKEPALNTPPEGFTALFNGKDLDNWQICIPIVEREKLKEKGGDAYEKAVEAANKKHLKQWTVKDGVLHYTGKGFSLQTVKDYGDFELWLDWKIAEKGDSGLYLRGQPQVQIWDSDKTEGAQGEDKGSGSGGLWNNPKGDKAKMPPGQGRQPRGGVEHVPHRDEGRRGHDQAERQARGGQGQAPELLPARQASACRRPHRAAAPRRPALVPQHLHQGVEERQVRAPRRPTVPQSRHRGLRGRSRSPKRLQQPTALLEPLRRWLLVS